MKKILITVKSRANSQPVCSVCGNPGSGYDTLPEREFQHIPFWGFQVFFLYSMRRVNCRHCRRIIVEKVPWSDGKNHLTHYYAKYLASWAKLISWKEVPIRFRTSWQTVAKAVEEIVGYGLKHRNIEGITAIGVDEVQWHKGHKYLTLVYQIDAGCRRLLWVGEKRTQKTQLRFFYHFDKIEKGFASSIEVICSDMWKPYLNVIAKKLPTAIHVLHKFHIMQKLGKAIDKVRASEVKRLKAKGENPVLAKSRWCFLKRKGNLTKKQSFKLKELLDINLKLSERIFLKNNFINSGNKKPNMG